MVCWFVCMVAYGMSQKGETGFFEVFQWVFCEGSIIAVPSGHACSMYYLPAKMLTVRYFQQKCQISGKAHQPYIHAPFLC